MAETVATIDLVRSPSDLGITDEESVSLGPGYACEVPIAPHGIIAVSEAAGESEWPRPLDETSYSPFDENSHSPLDDTHESDIGCRIVASTAEGDLILSGTVVDVDPDTIITDRGTRRYFVDPDPDGGRLAEMIDQHKHEKLDPYDIALYESMLDMGQDEDEDESTQSQGRGDSVHRRMENATQLRAAGDPWLEQNGSGFVGIYRFETGTQPTPSEVLAEETLLMPNVAGQGMPTHYRESMYAYLLRLWQWLHTESIDPRPYLEGSVRGFDADYSEPLALADDLGLTTSNAPPTQRAALYIHDQGFNEWRISFGGSLARWAPTTEFEWTSEKQLSDRREQRAKANDDSLPPTVFDHIEADMDDS